MSIYIMYRILRRRCLLKKKFGNCCYAIKNWNKKKSYTYKYICVLHYI